MRLLKELKESLVWVLVSHMGLTVVSEAVPVEITKRLFCYKNSQI